MRNQSEFLITAVIIMGCCFISCNKQDDLLMPPSGNIGTINSKPVVSGQVFTVSPSGNYEDDSYLIQTALNNAAEAGSGNTVQLTEGTFYLDKGIEVEGFDGFFKGAGKEKTLITTMGPIQFSLAYGELESLIKFRHGNINISDLAIKISNPNPCTGLNDNDWWKNSLPAVIMITGNSFYDPPSIDQIVDATFNNVQFIGGAGDFFGFNVAHFIYIGWEGLTPNYVLYGDLKFTNCKFQTAMVCITSGSSNGTWSIGGVDSFGNKFEDVGYGIALEDCSNASISISSNYFERIYYAAVQLIQGAYVDPSTLTLSKFLVQNNYIEVESSGDAVLLFDYGFYNAEGKKMDVNITTNKIYLNNTNWGGIFGYSAQDVFVTNNQIWGNGIAGIYSGILDDLCSDWILVGNNVQKVDAYVAPIWLGQGTSNYTVIGGSSKTNVLDEGTGNILIGVNNMHGNPHGPEIREAMMRKLEMMESFMRLRSE